MNQLTSWADQAALDIVPKDKISEAELSDYRASIKGQIFRAIRGRINRLKELGFTQKDLASRLEMDPAQLSRQIKGAENLTLESLSDLARGIECRLDVSLTPLRMVPKFYIRVIEAKVVITALPSSKAIRFYPEPAALKSAYQGMNTPTATYFQSVTEYVSTIAP